MERRTVLASVGGAVLGAAGYAVFLDSDDGDGSGSADPTVVGNPDGDEAQLLRVEVTVLEDGSPLANQLVRFHDYGGSYDRLEGTTDAEGTIVFYDSMGPPPCNPVEIGVPEYDEVVAVGCHNGGKGLSETVDVGSEA